MIAAKQGIRDVGGNKQLTNNTIVYTCNAKIATKAATM